MPRPLGVSECSNCGAHSAVYETYPTCNSCLELFCHECYVEGTNYEWEGRKYCTCGNCQAAADADWDEDDDLIDAEVPDPDEPATDVDFNS